MLTSFSTPNPPQPDVKPICPFFYECGGCESQDISYPQQIATKGQWLRLLFAPVSSPETPWRPFLHSSDPYPVFFRNKIRFSFLQTEQGILPSRHRKGEEAAEIAVDKCFLQSEESVEVVNWTAKFAEKHGWSLYSPNTGTGWLKHLLLRQSKRTGEMLLSLVTDDTPIPDREAWIKEITGTFPMVRSLWHTVSWGKSNEKLTDTHLWGDTVLHDYIGNFRFAVSPQSFFQTNGSMVETLYEAVKETANLQPQETLWDLYAGSATIGIYLSQAAKRVVCIENNLANIADAALNLEINKVTNVQMVGGSVEERLTSAFINEFGPADVIVVDPPRAGLHSSLKRILPHLGSHRLVYVSCNPLTCVRDIQELQRSGYYLRSLQGVDMFPHTWHCEVIAELGI